MGEPGELLTVFHDFRSIFPWFSVCSRIHRLENHHHHSSLIIVNPYQNKHYCTNHSHSPLSSTATNRFNPQLGFDRQDQISTRMNQQYYPPIPSLINQYLPSWSITHYQQSLSIINHHLTINEPSTNYQPSFTHDPSLTIINNHLPASELSSTIDHTLTIIRNHHSTITTIKNYLPPLTMPITIVFPMIAGCYPNHYLVGELTHSHFFGDAL